MILLSKVACNFINCRTLLRLLHLNSRAMAKPKSCSLICLQRSHEPIPLPDGIAVVIGRTPLTRITDPRCSRNQVELTANWSQKQVTVHQLATNNTSIDGTDIGKSKQTVLSDQSTLFILSGQYPHQVVFEEDDSYKSKNDDSSVHLNSSSSINNDGLKKPVKRSHSGEDESSASKKKKMEEFDGEKMKLKMEKSKSSSKSQSQGNSSKHSSDSQHQREKKGKDDSLDDENEHLKNVEAKLSQMKQNVKHESETFHSSKNGSQSQSSSSSKNKKETSKSSGKPSRTESSSSSSSKTNCEPTPDSEWTTHEHLVVFTSKGVFHRRKIAGFDIDGTIILTKSGKTFPTDSSDWKIAHSEIFGKLKSLHKDGYKIVFFTNQLGVARGKVKIEDLKTKIENIIRHLQVPVQVFVATNSGKYRKPMDGMWRKLKSQYNGGLSIDTSACFYIGDAAGRPANWEPKKKKDFSSSDRLFAVNIGVKFQTPEEYFLKHKEAKFNMPSFDPRALPAKGEWVPKGHKLTLDTKEIIVLVGFPACGKSHFAKYALKPKGYVVVNRDTLGSWQKCVKITKESIINSSVVVDNTNLLPDERERYIKCAKQENVPCRCFHFTTSVEHCRHNERFREMTDKNHAHINEMVFNKIKASYKEPTLSEGFTEIVKISFVPKFSSSSIETDYRKFLLEK